MIAVTIAVGFATWAWARSSASNSESNLGNAIGQNINYLKENFVIINANYSSTSNQYVTLWFYNSGNTTVYIKQVWISNVTSTEPWTYTNSSLSTGGPSGCTTCLKLTIGAITYVKLNANTALKSGVVYQFKALGQYGNTYSYQQSK